MNGVKIIIGLGNPGEKYRHSRHNMGFMVLEELARDLGLKFQEEKKFFSETARGTWGENEVVLVKPLTFMNDSGRAVAALKNFYKLDNKDLLVVQDEIDLRLGSMRYSPDAGSAGHKGIESIHDAAGNDVPRLRIGIDNRISRLEVDTDKYVLQNFAEQEELRVRKKILPQAIAEIKKIVFSDLPRAQGLAG